MREDGPASGLIYAALPCIFVASCETLLGLNKKLFYVLMSCEMWYSRSNICVYNFVRCFDDKCRMDVVFDRQAAIKFSGMSEKAYNRSFISMQNGIGVK